MPAQIVTKTCTQCQRSLPATTAFFQKRSYTPGFLPQCRRCLNHAHREWYHRNKDARRAKRQAYNRANREKKARYNRQYRQENLKRLREKERWYREQNKDRKKLYNREYRNRNKEKIAAKQREYRRRNKFILNAYKRRQYAKQPWQAIERRQRRRARILGALKNDLTPQQWEAIKAHYKHRCVYCGTRPKRLTKDHILPLSKGGNHSVDNVVPACLSCNSRKQAGAPPKPVQPLLFLSD